MHITIKNVKADFLSLTHLSQFLQGPWTYYNETWTTEIQIGSYKSQTLDKKGLTKFGSVRGGDT